MGYKDNFKVALYEVFGVGERPEPADDKIILKPACSGKAETENPADSACGGKSTYSYHAPQKAGQRL